MTQQEQDHLDGALIHAADFDDVAEVRELLAAGANPLGHRGYPIIMAIQAPSVASLEAMLQHGADPNFSYDGTTPLIRAIERCEPDMVRLILDSGADPRTPDASGRTPLDATADCQSRRSTPGKIAQINQEIERAVANPSFQRTAKRPLN